MEMDGLMVVLWMVPMAQGQMICSEKAPPTIWQVPEPFQCGGNYQFNDTRNVQLTMYRENIHEYVSTARVCRKIKTMVKTWSNLIGWNREHQIVKEEIPVEESECFQMVHFKRCEEGELELKDGVWKTSYYGDSTGFFTEVSCRGKAHGPPWIIYIHLYYSSFTELS